MPRQPDVGIVEPKAARLQPDHPFLHEVPRLDAEDAVVGGDRLPDYRVGNRAPIGESHEGALDDRQHGLERQQLLHLGTIEDQHFRHI